MISIISDLRLSQRSLYQLFFSFALEGNGFPASSCCTLFFRHSHISFLFMHRLAIYQPPADSCHAYFLSFQSLILTLHDLLASLLFLPSSFTLHFPFSIPLPVLLHCTLPPSSPLLASHFLLSPHEAPLSPHLTLLPGTFVAALWLPAPAPARPRRFIGPLSGQIKFE
jgi:hypothetical protein